MASDMAETELKEMIQSFYRFANVPIGWDLKVNERVAEVFGVMLSETKKCSDAFGWIPIPPGGRASIAWLVMQLGRGAFNHHRSRLSFVCARRVIDVWNSQLQMASMGIATARLPKWA